MKIKEVLNNALAIMRVRQPVGGLEISDSALRYVFFRGGKWQLASVHLAPGVFVLGEVKEKEEFISALKNLHSAVFGALSRKKMSVAVSLSSANIYSQIFNLPMVEGENLDKAVELNLQMASPGSLAETYSSWQPLYEDETNYRLEIQSAFIRRTVADDVRSALTEAGFSPVVLEWRALSLARLIRSVAAGFDKEKSYICLNLDADVMDIFILRRGLLYFDYLNYWRDVQGDERDITLNSFKEAVTRNLHSVINFYSSHWSDPVREIFIVSTGLKDEIKETIKANFNFDVLDVALGMERSPSEEWFVTLGAAIRGETPRDQDEEISLLGIDASEEFRREEVMGFAKFWRVMTPVALAVLFAVFFGSYIFLKSQKDNLESASLKIPPQQENEINSLEKQATEFNRLVALVTQIDLGNFSKASVLERVKNIADGAGIVLNRFYFLGGGGQALITGTAKSQDQLLNFKKAMEVDSHFQNVKLPLEGVKSGPDGLSFSVNFSINSANTK